MMSDQSGSQAGASRLAPHPLLKSYYADEPGRKRRVNEMFDESAPARVRTHEPWWSDWLDEPSAAAGFTPV